MHQHHMIPHFHMESKSNRNLDIFKDLKDIYFLLSQWVPEYPGRHVQRYPVGPLMTHDPLFRHGEDEQMSTEITKLKLVDI